MDEEQSLTRNLQKRVSRTPQKHLWLMKVLCFVETIVLIIPAIANPSNIVRHIIKTQNEQKNKIDLSNAHIDNKLFLC